MGICLDGGLHLFRKLAKTRKWRQRYDLATATGSQFLPGAVSEWDELKVQFTMWCQFYHAVYDSMDKPAEATIQDDEALDSWLRNKQIQRKKLELQSKTGSGHG